MKFGGVTLKGARHTVNQDSFAVREVSGGFVAAVSDGLGSKRHSQAGSAALCLAACDVANEFSCVVTNEKNFLAAIHSRWLEILRQSHLEINDCNATALIGVLGAENLWLFRLGDGFICAVNDGRATLLFDDKEENFINEVECLREDFSFEKWEVLRVAKKNFTGLVAATDGVTFRLDEENICTFTKDFCANYGLMTLSEILADVNLWLPTLAGSDDKTLAFLLSEVVL